LIPFMSEATAAGGSGRSIGEAAAYIDICRGRENSATLAQLGPEVPKNSPLYSPAGQRT
jgi:hypothetical protein